MANEWAFEGEKIIHGNPFGIDNTVSTMGMLLMFEFIIFVFIIHFFCFFPDYISTNYGIGNLIKLESGA